MPGYTAGTWFGLSVTAGTPREIVMKINADVRQIMAEPAIQEQFVTKQLYEPMTSSPEEFAEFIRTETAALGQDHPRAEPADRPLTLGARMLVEPELTPGARR